MSLTSNPIQTRLDGAMSELRIGDVNRKTGRTTEMIRRAERAGLIPKARRSRGGFRYWDEADIPAICKGLGVLTPEERLMQDINNIAAKLGLDSLDDLLAIFQELAPVIGREVERVTGGQVTMRELTRN